MPKIDIDQFPSTPRLTIRRHPIRPSRATRAKRLGRTAGLHENEDELIYVLEGEVVLCEDGGETVLRPGDAATWKAGVPNRHCLINRF